MGNTKSTLNIEDIELNKISYITKKEAEINFIEDTHNFIDVDGTLCFVSADDLIFYCDFSYDKQITNTIIVHNGSPIEYDNELLHNFIILFVKQLEQNLFEMHIKTENNEIEKILLNVNRFWKYIK